MGRNSPPQSVEARQEASAHAPVCTLPGWFIPAAAGLCLLFIVATLLAHVLFQADSAHLVGFAIYDVDQEANLPTWLSSMLLNIAAVLAFVISSSDAPVLRRPWRGIALLLALMSMDEIACLHNVPSRRLFEWLGADNGYLMNAWVLPAGLLSLGILCVYLPFLLQVRRRVALGLMLAGALYLTGALGLEILGSKLEFDTGGMDYDGASRYSLAFEICTVAEEFFEFAGLLVTLSVLRKHAITVGAELRLSFAARCTP